MPFFKQSSLILPLFNEKSSIFNRNKRGLKRTFFIFLLSTSLIINLFYFFSINFDSSIIFPYNVENNNDNNSNVPHPPHPELLDLIIVAGHAIFVGNDISKVSSVEGWILEEFQKDEVKTFLSHIRKGLELVENNKNALLVFSG